MTSRRTYPRTARLNEVVREVVADEVERLEDPRLGFITVTGAEVSPDLHHATIYYSVFGSAEAHEATQAALESAIPHLRATLGRQVRMKHLPALTFKEDPGMAAGQRVDEIIRSLHRDDEA